MSNNVQPIFILPEGTQRTSGKSAQKINIQAAKLVADQVRTTLGPKGMDKMIVDTLGDITITNDGVTILQEMNIEHPSAKMIVEIAKTQEHEVGDGTTTAVVLAGELLKNAEYLLEQDVHPTVVVNGYRMAATKAQEVLQGIGATVGTKDKELLKHIAMTAMTGKGAESAKELLGGLLVRAALNVSEVVDGKTVIDSSNIKLEKQIGAGVESTELVEGIVLDKEKVHAGMPRRIEQAKIAIIDSAIEIKDTETDAKIQITNPSQMQAFIDQEEKMLRDMVEKIIASGANVVLCQKGIDDIAQHFLSKQGIYAVRRVKKSDMDKLAMATGATITTNMDDLTVKDLGYAGVVEEMVFGDDTFTFVRGCKNPKAVTLLVRGGTEHVADEVKRALDDGIGVLAAALEDGKIVAGAGAPEMELSKTLKKFASGVGGKEQLAIEAFATALEVIPRTLSESAGLDPIDKIAELKAAHDKGQTWAGINVFTGKIMDAWRARVIEPLRIKTQAVKSASEVAMMILRIDDIIQGGSGGGRGPGPEAPMGMPPGMGGMM